MKRYFAFTACDMLEILFMKYHSVLSAVIENKTATPKIQFYKYQVDVVCRGTFSCGLSKITGWCSFEKDSQFI
jgi:hypothetical protein